MKKVDNFHIGLLIFTVLLLLAMGIGWVMNIIKLVNCDFVAPYKCEVIHGIGIIPPVGMVTGWLDVGK